MSTPAANNTIDPHNKKSGRPLVLPPQQDELPSAASAGVPPPQQDALAAGALGAQQAATLPVSGAFKEEMGESLIIERRKSSRLLSSPAGGLEQQSDILWSEVTPVSQNVNRVLRIAGIQSGLLA
jgi:hypothetical protein